LWRSSLPQRRHFTVAGMDPTNLTSKLAFWDCPARTVVVWSDTMALEKARVNLRKTYEVS